MAHVKRCIDHILFVLSESKAEVNDSLQKLQRQKLEPITRFGVTFRMR